MIQATKSSAENFLSPVISGHGNALNRVATQTSNFANLLDQKMTSTEVTKTEAWNTKDLQNLGMAPSIHQVNPADSDPAAVNETTLNGKLPEDEPKTAEEALQQFVGEAFFGMMMKQMRSSVIKSDLMGSSNAQKTFESQFDQMIVEEMAENSSQQLAEPMYEQMMRLKRS